MMRNLRTLLSGSLILSLLACTAPVARERIIEPPRSPVADLQFAPLEFKVPQVERVLLPNGIRLYLKEDHELPLVSATAMVNAGSISVPAAKTGLADLLAVLLRTGGAGARAPDAVDVALEMMAADLGVSADSYATSFGLSVQAKDVGAGLAILADMVRRPQFDPQRLELARRQAIEAIRRQNDEPDQIAARAIMRAIYGDHPLGRTPTEETVANVDRDDLRRFHETYFAPNNLWLAITGDFDRQQLMALLEKLFGDWQPREFARQTIPPVTPSPESLILLAPKEIPQTTILIGQMGIDKSAPDLQAVRVMNYILGGGGFNSRLMREIRSDRGLAYSVYSYFQIGRWLPGPFIAGTETKSASTLEALRLIREIIAEMQQKPVQEAELQVAKDSLINSFIFAFTDTHETVTQQMRLDFYEYPDDYLQTLREKIAAVTADDVLRAAREHLDPARQKIVLVGNPAAFDGDPALLGPVKQVQKTGEFK